MDDQEGESEVYVSDVSVNEGPLAVLHKEYEKHKE